MRVRLCIIAAVLALISAACGSSSTTTTNAAGISATLDAFVSAYNADDLEGVMALFADDSSMFVHPVNAFAIGVDEIRRAFSEDVGQGLSVKISNVSIEDFPADDASGVEAYSVVRWVQTWSTVVNGEEVCRSGVNFAAISGGTIERLNWTRIVCQ